MRSLDPLKAVTQRDADGLQQALTQGWRPPTIRAHLGAQPDFSVWTETVMLDWAEGLGLLDDFLPAITRRAEVMDAAVRNTSVGCVQLLWNRLGLTVDSNPKQNNDGSEQTLIEKDLEERDGDDESISDLSPNEARTESPLGPSDVVDQAHEMTAIDLSEAPKFRLAKRGGVKTLGPGHTTKVTERMTHVWCRGLITAMGEPWTQNHEAKNVIPLVRFFQERGVDLNTYIYPGDYETGDFRRSGHSLWTRAMLLKDWPLVTILWPKNEQIWKAWPRNNEVLLHLLDVVVGDYRGLRTDEIGLVGENYGVIDWENQILSLTEEEKDETRSIAIDRAAIQMETETFLRWTSEYGTEWAMQDELRQQLVQPTTQKISAWLRLPSTIKSGRDRAIVWKIWDHVCSRDLHRSWLTDLTLWPEDPDVRDLIRTAQGDDCAAFRNGWNAPLADGSPSPEQRWIDMDGNHQLTEWMVPSN